MPTLLRFLSLLEKEIYLDSSPIWDLEFHQNPPAHIATAAVASKKNPTKKMLDQDTEDKQGKQTTKTTRMVQVMVDGMREDASGRKECLARRLLPLTVEPGLTMVMALEDSCMACGVNCLTCGEPCLVLCEGCCKASEASNEDERQCPDSSSFLRSLELLPKDECLRVTRPEVKETLSQLVPCVGCRHSVETLFQALQQSEGGALHPLAISQDGEVFLPQIHMATPDALARLFVPTVMQLSSHLLGLQGVRGGKGKRGGITRCPQHAVGTSKSPVASTWTWKDTWENMENECREAATMLPKPVLSATIDEYLKKQRFSPDSALMVNRAFSQLVENGQEPATVGGERSSYVDEERNLFNVISTCIKAGHLHVQCDYVSQLITMAEPHINGLKQMRHAKSINDAEKEVLICIGIALFERFQRIQQKIDEGKRSCDLLLLVCLKSLRHKMEVAAERMKGETYVDQLCLELENVEVNNRGAKKKKKKERKRKEKLVECEEKETHGGGLNVAHTQHSSARSDEEENVANEDKENGSANQKKETKNICHGIKKEFLPAALDNNVTLVSAFSSSRCSNPSLSLTEMLEDEEKAVNEIEPIPADVITSFNRSKEKTTELRKELRKDLKQRFANYCNCHNTQYCPEWCVQKTSLIASRYSSTNK